MIGERIKYLRQQKGNSHLISEAIDQGLTRDDFRTFQDLIKFKRY